jgi:hypothetical protein
VAKNFYDFKKHPLYILGFGIFVGVSVTYSVLMYFQNELYIRKSEVLKYLKEQGKIVVDEIKYNGLKLSDEKNKKTGQNKEHINDQYDGIKITKESPIVNLEKFDKNLSVLLLKVDGNRVRLQINNDLSTTQPKRFYLNLENISKWEFNNKKYALRLLKIYENEGALINITQY